MAMSFREKSRLRKLIYAGLIVLLFSGMYIHRVQVVEAAADDYNLAETNLGDLDLGGSAANYALVSFRAPLVTVLWYEAEELKGRHEWDKHKVVVTAISKLQPHFRGPWEYQGWNLAYNVSVEFDRAEDKYDYITQGVQWLVEGERMTRYRLKEKDGSRPVVGDPVLRNYIGHVIQGKMTIADEHDFYRCFFELSSTPPNRWDPEILEVNADKRKEFKEDFPQLMRRIGNLKSIPEGAENQFDAELIRFLADHRALPSRYDWKVYRDTKRSQLKADRAEHWPLWPEMKEIADINLEEEDNQNPFGVAYWWYVFATEPLPPEGYEQYMSDAQVKKDRRFRLPRMRMLLFRAFPPLTKTHHATDLGKIGAFTGKGGSREKWVEAFEAWVEFERKNRLDLNFQKLQELTAASEPYRRNFPHLANERKPPPEDQMTPEMRAAYQAFIDLFVISEGRESGRSDYRRREAEVNKSNECIQARKHFYNAKYLYRSDLALATAEYEKALRIWKWLMIRPQLPEWRRRIELTLLHMPLGGVDGMNGVAALCGSELCYEAMLYKLHPDAFICRTLPLEQMFARVGAAPLGLAGPADALTRAVLPTAMQSAVNPFPADPALGYRLDFEVYEYTPWGMEPQVQEDTWELLEGYLSMRAKMLTPGYLIGAWTIWEHEKALGMAALAPQVPAIALAGFPDPRLLATAAEPSKRNPDITPLSDITLDWVENMLEGQPMILDTYLRKNFRRTPDLRVDGVQRPTGGIRPGNDFRLMLPPKPKSQ